MSEPARRRPTARDRAAEVLTLAYDGEVIAHEELERLQAEAPLSSADDALVRELVLGILRRRLTCEHIASRFYRGRWAGLRPAQRVVLALGVYQLCFLERVPDHAAVDQTVRQAKRFGRGFGDIVNAILRRVIAVRGDVVPNAELAESPGAPGDQSVGDGNSTVAIDGRIELNPRRALPLDGHRTRIFTDDLFPDPARRPLDFLVAATNTPPWLVERWHRRFKPRLCRQICDAGWRRPVLSLRPNRLRLNSSELMVRLATEGLESQWIAGTSPPAFNATEEVPDLWHEYAPVVLRAAPAAGSIGAVAEGLCQPQDATAQLAIAMARPSPGSFVLDLCAGVGTKSTQAAEWMRDDGMVLATDLHAEKLEHVRTGAARLGLRCIRAVPMDALDRELSAIGRPPDVIVLDVPCLNTGVLARRPEARYRASQKALESVRLIQADILRRAAALAGPASSIVYSTCSLEREENEDQVQAFCAEFPAWRRERERFTLPSDLWDGGYVAVLRQS